MALLGIASAPILGALGATVLQPVTAAAGQTITIQGFAFSPNPDSASPGTVTISNADTGIPHSVTLCTQSACSGATPCTGGPCGSTFDTGIFTGGPGMTRTISIGSAGRYVYYCRQHGYGSMHAEVDVGTGPAPGPSPVPTPTHSNPAPPPPAPTHSNPPAPAPTSAVPAPKTSAPAQQALAPTPTPSTDPSPSPSPSSSAASIATAPASSNGNGSPVALVVAVLAVAVIGGAGFYWYRRRQLA